MFDSIIFFISSLVYLDKLNLVTLERIKLKQCLSEWKKLKLLLHIKADSSQNTFKKAILELDGHFLGISY